MSEGAVLEQDPDTFVRQLVEFAAASGVGMREHFRMAKVWLRDPTATQRAFAARSTLKEHQVLDLLRALTRDLETMGAA